MSDVKAHRVTFSSQVPQIIRCAYDGDLPGVERLIQQSPDYLFHTDPRTGMNALHVAIGNNDLAMTKRLTEAGAHYIPDKAGRRPSTIAEMCEVDDELLDFVIDKEAETASGERIGQDLIWDQKKP